MCFAVYIGTEKELELGKFVPEQTDIYFEKLTDEEENNLRSKFSKTNIYYVGSDTNCSCGLSLEFLNPNEILNNQSPAKFLEFLNEMTLYEDVEFYCCLEGDWSLPIEKIREIDIREISIEKNYFGLTEKEFIKFKQKTIK